MLERLLSRFRRHRFAVWITPEIAIGPRLSSDRVGALVREGVGSVIDARAEACDDEQALAEKGIHFLHVPVVDRRPPTQRQLKEATGWALKEIAAGRRVYVHCHSGIGRSPCLATAVLMAIGYPCDEAFQAVQRRRPWATLTAGQRTALEKFETHLQTQRLHAAEATS